MCTQDENPYRSPETAIVPVVPTASPEPRAGACRSAKIVLCCLGVHAFAMARWFFFFDAGPGWIDDIVAGSLILSLLVGVVFSISAVRRRGLVNRATGLVGLLWFSFYILLAIAAS